jgi:hypothetical protein
MLTARNQPAEAIDATNAVAESCAAFEAGVASRASTGPSRPPDGKFFDVDPVFLAAGTVRPYVRQPGDPLYRPLRIYTLDPTASRLDGAVATVNVPYEPLGPGPQGRLLEVLDQEILDWDNDKNDPVELDDPRVLIRDGRAPSVTDRKFHQQMVYAVCTSVYDVFREALGRDPSWGFAARFGKEQPVLRIRPHAFDGQNAFYDPRPGELNFGFFTAETAKGPNLPHGRVFACLSHDIVAHEMTHAVLDGMRARFRFATNPDVLGFHEGFADLVAIFMHFSYREVVLAAIERSAGMPEIDGLLLSVARQFGQTMTRPDQSGPLRSAIEGEGIHSANSESKPKTYAEAGQEPHALGSILVSAVFEAFAVVFQRKTRAYRRLAGSASAESIRPELADILASEASKLASQFLSICIRAIDYCPPIDLHLGEYLRALITADYDLVPDDPVGYREAFIDAFARRGIFPEGVLNLSEDALLWRPPTSTIKAQPIQGLHFSVLRFAGDPGRAADATELRRQAEAIGAYVMRPGIAPEFGCALPGDPALEGDRVEPARVCSVRSLRRIGPDKQISFELVAEIVQRRWLTGPAGRPCEFHGGSTVIIGPDGQIRYLISKCVANPKRAKEQLQRLGSIESGKARKAQDGRLFVPQMGLCELHGCTPKNGRLVPEIQSPEDAAISPIGRGGGGQNALQPEERR